MLPLVILAVVVIFATISLCRSKRKRHPPPGPRRLPIVGNAAQLPRDEAWLVFSQWKKDYGQLVYIELFGQPTLIINSHKAAINLMTRRARLYSERPWNYVAGQLLMGGHSMAFMNNNDRWKTIRKVAHEGLRKASLVGYRKAQSIEAIRVTTSLLESSSEWERHFMTNSSSVILSSVYGLPPTDDSDSTTQKITGIVDKLARALYPGAYLVESIHFLRHVPAWAASWKREALSSHASDHAFLRDLLSAARHASSGDASKVPFAHLVFDAMDNGLIKESEAAWLCGTLFIAGSETTSASFAWFLLAMVVNEAVRTKAQEEIDRVVGRDRPPAFTDMQELVYLSAVIKEVLRWRPPLPLGLLHCTAIDDVYDGFDIPAGTVCIPNIWEINRDQDVWGPDADDFRPERHISADGTLNQHVLSGHDDCHTSFGFGQRICVGRHFAAETMFITCATILWACDISPALDAQGVPKLPSEHEHKNKGVCLHPVNFDCRIRVRTADSLQRLTAARQNVS